MKSLILSTSLTLHAEEVVKPTPPAKTNDDLQVCKSVIPGEIASYEKIIERFGKTNVDAKTFARSEEGLQDYIDQSGIRYFSAHEISRPNNEKSAVTCGLQGLIPPQCIWANGMALMTISEKIRELIAGPIIFRNWYRPTCYNSLVDGAKGSDHLLAKSFDIDFRKPQDRAVAQKFLCDELWKKGENIQVGIGCSSLHIGLGSPRGKRFWLYGTMENCPVKMLDNCWAFIPKKPVQPSPVKPVSPAVK